MTIPSVLDHLQQVRERAGLPPLQTDPMLAYEANLDALLTEHMATHRILATQVTDVGQAVRGNTARLNDLRTTQVGIGVTLTERGDSVVVILLGRQVTEARAPAVSGIRTPTSATSPTPYAAIQPAIPNPDEIPAVHDERLRLRTPRPKLMLWHGPIQKDQPTLTRPSDDLGVAATVALPPPNHGKPET